MAAPASPWKTLARRLKWATLLGLLTGTAYTSFIWDPPPSVAEDEDSLLARAKPVDPVLRPLKPRAVAVRGLGEAFADSKRASARAKLGARPEHRTAVRAPGDGWAIPAGQVNLAAAKREGDVLVQQLADGSALEFTVAPGLQHDAIQSLAKYRAQYGALVVLNPKTGEVLAMAERDVSPHPTRGIALKADGPAASVFKVVTSAALIDKGGLKSSDKICTHGGARRLDARHLVDNKRKDRWCQTFAEAHGASNNVAYARWADRLLEPEQLGATADTFMFNRRIPFLWKVGVSDATVPRASRLGFAKTAAGFQGTKLSPMHGALIAATVANGGTMMTPRLIRSAKAPSGEEAYSAEWKTLSKVMSPATAREVTTLMKQTTVGEGSAARYFLRRKKFARVRDINGAVAVAGKTGTLSNRGRNFSWFVGFAPADDPEIALAALVVNGKVWTTKGAVVAREFFQRYFSRKKRQQKKAKRAAERAAKRSKK